MNKYFGYFSRQNVSQGMCSRLDVSIGDTTERSCEQDFTFTLVERAVTYTTIDQHKHVALHGEFTASLVNA